MREQYIKKVKKELSLPSKAKSEVLRDLIEMFDSALEHGETEEQLIERLGSPEAFAEETAKQLGYEGGLRKKRAELIIGVVFLLVAVAILIIYAVASFSRMPAHVGIIGSADGPTTIVVASSISSALILPIFGMLAAVIALICLCRRLKGKKKILAIVGIALLCLLLIFFVIYHFPLYRALVK